MPTSTTVVSAEGVELEVRVMAGSGHALTIEYRLRNPGEAPLAVFDRGQSGPGAARLSAGTGSSTPPPLSEPLPDGLSLNHVALPLPKPVPTVPRVSLATRVDAGGAHEGRFVASIDSSVKRVRYCLGTAPFDAIAFQPQSGSEPAAWRTPFVIAATQRRLCTAWYSVADQRFEER